MPYPDWGETYGQFAIEFGGRTKAAITKAKGNKNRRRQYDWPSGNRIRMCCIQDYGIRKRGIVRRVPGYAYGFLYGR